ncbi:Zn(2)-C6 fungal-type domain-containing protein [Mycena indigotica]|uniref:Zn(2)-C6 fungal-type domain-containing protein n=1 Tax=Mycena indigotica TaxID=2126181 RepID=A0A8H6VVM7_9AGAR|nr:Zn(2)-C6 fungal-type domain-containing protein [Mycena indigotica]KAF7293581.1 Zn(2)-C6 fungal-type domain-containing protein [Mycena indigotica]
MSASADEDGTRSKLKRVARACDMCRRKKRRCSGGDPCGHCKKHDFVCTYLDQPFDGQQDPRPSAAYVAALEARLETVEDLLRQARAAKSPGVQLINNAIQRLNNPFPEPHSDDLAFTQIEASFKALSINHPAAQGFQGKSSGGMLVKAAVDLWKKDGTLPSSSPEFDKRNSGRTLQTPLQTRGWGDLAPASSFPDEDLLETLIALYFDNVNAFLPLLHRPTFQAEVTQKLHLRHGGFAKTVLLVCAVAARYSTDPRVSLTNVDVSPAETAGWKWFDQVQLTGHLVHKTPTLHDLQCYCLAAEFLDCTSTPRVTWTLVGFGVRLSQDMGAHRYKKHERRHQFEQELEKRASWILFLFESQISTALGRTFALQSHDFDIQLPILCDDEYWGSADDSSVPLFRQPTQQPSRIDYFVFMLQLNRILSFSCKILYSSNRSKSLIGLGDDQWEEQVVVELDSALNRWFEALPPHLQWNPDSLLEDDIFFDQSAALHCSYYHTRIVIHRPFIPAMRRESNPAVCNHLFDFYYFLFNLLYSISLRSLSVILQRERAVMWRRFNRNVVPTTRSGSARHLCLPQESSCF